MLGVSTPKEVGRATSHPANGSSSQGHSHHRPFGNFISNVLPALPSKPPS